MAAKEVKKATTNLTCPICYQLFKNPKYLPCYHSYCEECLEKMVVQSKIACPECRQEAVVPARGVKELANNFFINRMVDELVLQRKVEGEEEVKCDECDEDEPVVSYCPECNMFLCHICNDLHKRSKRFRGHGIVLLTELRSNKDVPFQAKTVAPMCKEHDIELLFYCETCEQLVCLYCTVKDHNGHNHDTVKKMAGKHRQELKEITAPVEEMITSLSEAHDNIDKVRVKIRQKGDKVNKRIDQHYDGLVLKLMEQKEQLKQQVYDTVSQKEKAVTTQLEEMKLAQAEMLSMKELKDAMEKSTDQEALSAKKQVIDRMQQLNDKCKKLNTQPVQSATMEIVFSKDSIPQFVQLYTHIDPTVCEVVNIPKQVMVGKSIKFTIITKYSTGYPCSIGGSQVSVQAQFSTGEVTATRVRDNNDGSYTASFVAQQAGELKLSVSIDGYHFKGSPYGMSVFYSYTAISKRPKIVTSKSSNAWGIACSNIGIWAVANNGNSCVSIFDDQNQFLRKVGSCGTNKGQFNRPRGLAFDCNNHLYVADCGNNRVQKFDIQGNYLLQYGHSSLICPSGVTVHDGVVYVTEPDQQRISVFQADGRLSRFICKGTVCTPNDVVVNINNQLLVADGGHHCIYAFTLDGSYVAKYGSKGTDKGQLNEPYSVSVDCIGSIFIAERGNAISDRLSIFDKDGHFIHSFGSRGNNAGQFNGPYGIAVNSNNYIYVTDYGHSRIQIFSVSQKQQY